MSKQRSEIEAPLSRLQKFLEPYFSGSPSAEAFAPGVLDENALVPMQLSEATPWRGPSGPVPDPSKQEKRRRGKQQPAGEGAWSGERPDLGTQQLAPEPQVSAREPQPSPPQPQP